VTAGAYAQRNICYECKTINASDSIKCKECNIPLNLCLDCGTENPANADYCSKCNAPLAEMRVLGRIDQKTREELKLGQSERARIDKELMKISYLLEKNPENGEKLIFKRSMLLHRMDFFSREAESWREFLKKYPDSKKKSVANAYLSEALRKWAFLFYNQKNRESSLALYNEAVQANPMNNEAWEWIGRIQMEAGKNSEAAAAYMKALEASPGSKTPIHFLKKLKVSIPDELLVKKEK
jgi:tetratricopeptide (TPR) repeat protein